jgi:hypothetical protein
VSPSPGVDRPDYIGPKWLGCTDGMAFAKIPPLNVQQGAALASRNPWERLASVTLQAQSGHFDGLPLLLDIVNKGADDHLRDCAIDVFALGAPSTVVEQLSVAFDHSDYDTRVEAYCQVRLTL